MDRSLAWWLNLGAERELAGGPPAPGLDLSGHARGLARTLVADHDWIVDTKGSLSPAGDAAHAPTAREGRAFCPTPGAQRALEKAGVTPAPVPSLPILRAANHRAFSAGLGPVLDGDVFVTEAATLFDLLRSPPPSASRWLLKAPFGFAGKGRRLVSPGPLLDASVLGFVDKALRQGGLQVQPYVHRLLDASAHGFLDEKGQLTLGEPITIANGPGGAFAAAHPDPLPTDFRRALLREAERVADALHGAGYFGPFGIDGFLYESARGVRACLRCDLNARYTMAWGLGMGDRRPDRRG